MLEALGLALGLGEGERDPDGLEEGLGDGLGVGSVHERSTMGQVSELRAAHAQALAWTSRVAMRSRAAVREVNSTPLTSWS